MHAFRKCNITVAYYTDIWCRLREYEYNNKIFYNSLQKYIELVSVALAQIYLKHKSKKKGRTREILITHENSQI